MLVGLAVGVGFVVAGGVVMQADALVGATPPPLPIVGGSDAAPCEWPAVVAIMEADETPVMCSGSLIHPEVVLTAAHCINPKRPIVGIGFGEAGQVFGEPSRVIAPTECVAHPDYAMLGYTDIAYCRLAEPVTDVPIVPLLAGCEAESLQPGGEVTIVGFGATWGTYVDDMVMATGVGAKRWITQTLVDVDVTYAEVAMAGENGSQSACFGDSGGPSMIELADGSWRVFGAGSHLFDPGGLPAPMEPGNICGTGVAYGYVVPATAWIEDATGIDVTPCWNGDEFVGGADCGSFPLAPGTASGTWDDGCSGGALGGGEMTCEPSSSDTGGESSSSGSADTSSTGDGESSSGGADTSSTGAPMTSTTMSGEETLITGADESDGTAGTSDEGGQAEGGGDGCGCDADGRTRGAWWLAVVPLVLRRRRSVER